MASCFIYVLELEDGCYYVGQTTAPTTRLQQHRDGKGSAWTRLHAPVRMCNLRKVRAGPEAGLEEDKETKTWMMRKGVDFVRGGAYACPVLPEAQASALSHEFGHAEGACLRCGRKGHFAAACYAGTHVDGRTLKRGRVASGAGTTSSAAFERQMVATRGARSQSCGISGSGHDIIEVPWYALGAVIGRGGKQIREIQTQSGAQLDIAEERECIERGRRTGGFMRGITITGTADCVERAKRMVLSIAKERRKAGVCPQAASLGHMYECRNGCGFKGSYETCIAHEHSCMHDSESESESESESDDGCHTCFRCGREGHYADRCYARTRVNGQAIKRHRRASCGSESE